MYAKKKKKKKKNYTNDVKCYNNDTVLHVSITKNQARP